MIQKTAKATGDLICNNCRWSYKSLKKFTKNNLETENIDNDKETPNQRYLFPQKRKRIIGDLRLM